MQFQAIAQASVVGSVKIFLATASPLQSLLDKPCVTHEFCNRQAITILSADGFSSCADFFLRYVDELNAGVVWADQGWKNVNHYFEPDSRKGLWQFSTAIEEFSRCLNRATRCMRRHETRKACFFLGAAAHLLQDLCVPHHARGKVFYGHKQYETWARDHCNAFAVTNGGVYRQGHRTNSLLVDNASVSADLLEWVVHEGDEALYAKATSILLPLAQRTTAGLLVRFYNNLCGHASAHAVSVA
ncbi:MAG: zinc dependent phospholipase [Anaerosporomusa subterranea]|jgi:phospholipase C|nr:zinc dependent phospholipase [Anaerosporomusa subterranea]